MSLPLVAGAASTDLAKALYALSAPLPASFTSGTFRLPYSQIENRAFFLGIARKVAILIKRGTWRTAAEFAKIGFGVSGGLDPLGMLLQYVLRSLELVALTLNVPRAGLTSWPPRLD